LAELTAKKINAPGSETTGAGMAAGRRMAAGMQMDVRVMDRANEKVTVRKEEETNRETTQVEATQHIRDARAG
jgi:membrane protease subunit (stomatin/prohibitin family)